MLDAQTILRRRHTVTILMRLLILALMLYSLLRWAEILYGYSITSGLMAWQQVWGFSLTPAVPLVVAGVLALVEKRLVRWIVPVVHMTTCPGCGYDFQNLAGTNCPECNLRLRAGP